VGVFGVDLGTSWAVPPLKPVCVFRCPCQTAMRICRGSGEWWSPRLMNRPSRALAVRRVAASRRPDDADEGGWDRVGVGGHHRRLQRRHIQPTSTTVVTVNRHRFRRVGSKPVGARLVGPPNAGWDDCAGPWGTVAVALAARLVWITARVGQRPVEQAERLCGHEVEPPPAKRR
jgi:hypothetical protein